MQNYKESDKHPYTYVNSIFVNDTSEFKSVDDVFKFVYETKNQRKNHSLPLRRQRDSYGVESFPNRHFSLYSDGVKPVYRLKCDEK